VADPSTETWRATFAASGQSQSARLRRAEQERDEAVSKTERVRGFWQECSRHRDEIQKALAASQADLTAMEAERDRLAVLNAELKADAERYLSTLTEVARDLATARYQNRILTAENEAALHRLNEMRGES
jgi:chromosome segregation ATPase